MQKEIESGIAEDSAGVGAAAEESGMTAGKQHFFCLLLRFVLLVSLLMRERGIDEELAGVGMAAGMAAGMGAGMGTAAVESGMTAGEQHFHCLLLSFVLLVSLLMR